MSGPVGHTFIYNLIIIFIVIVFGFLAGTMSYYKAFKINNRIITAIEKFEGNNQLAQQEINNVLSTLGYSSETANCKEKYKNMYRDDHTTPNYKYCIYHETDKPAKNTYYEYGVLTYMNIDLPFINRINIPIFTKTNKIYKFTDHNA